MNGQKIWTSGAHMSKFGILIARTDPNTSKHTGISYFICPMNTPGIEIRPIVEMTGVHMFNEVFFTDVRIPAENLVGAENDGWALAKVTLGNERVSLSSGGALWGRGPTAGDLLDVVRARGGVDDPVMRQELARLYIEEKVLDLIRLRTVSARIRGEQPGPEASIRKVMADEHGQRIMQIARDLCGSAGMISTSAPWVPRRTCGTTASCSAPPSRSEAAPARCSATSSVSVCWASRTTWTCRPRRRGSRYETISLVCITGTIVV